MVAGYDWFQPSDLPKFFHALQKAARPAILVGGQSLTFWVDYFKIPVPKSDTPYLTQDADVLATKHDARIVAAELHGTLNIPKPDDQTIPLFQATLFDLGKMPTLLDSLDTGRLMGDPL